jgi:lipopolysaccharide biosynthesis glycosyltransferase
MKEKIEILVSGDNNYVMPIGVMLTSLFENSKEDSFSIHMMTDKEFTEKNRNSLRNIVENRGGSISFYVMDDNLFQDFPIGLDYQSQHITSMAAYYRLFAAEVLPLEVEKIIYLDGDIIVRDSLRELWSTNIERHPIAAVPDIENCTVIHYNRLRYPQSLGYFNSGVLLINLKYWREHHVLKDFLQIVRDKRPILRCHDQDIMNLLFRENKIVLPLKYNMENCFLFCREQVPLTYVFDEQIKEGQQHPVIVHFSACPKLWHKDSHHPYKAEFVYYRNMTEWKDMHEQRHYCGRHRFYWALVNFAIWIGWSAPNNNPDNYYVKAETMHGNP